MEDKQTNSHEPDSPDLLSRDSCPEKIVYDNTYEIWPPGHYYSPIPDLIETAKNKGRIYKTIDRIPGVDLNDPGQIELFNCLAEYYSELPFPDDRTPGFRYHYNNMFYPATDAILLFCMIMHLKPQKIVEIGSGFSSAAILDVNEKFFDNQIKCTFIEPYPDRLLSLISDDDMKNFTLIKTRTEEVDLNVFDNLSENDILFIDSTHVSKIGSDVNRILFEVLPRLNKGVFIHFHDVFYPFEYPLCWVNEGRFWNEVYLLRAFLQYNDTFKVKLFSTYFNTKYQDIIRHKMPILAKNGGNIVYGEKPGFEKCEGGCIWLKKEK